MKRYIVSALAIFVVFLTQSLLSGSNSDSELAGLVPGTDYVRGELIVVFSEAAKPTASVLTSGCCGPLGEVWKVNG